MASLYEGKAFRDAAVGGMDSRPQFPDGYEGEAAIINTYDKMDGFWGPRHITELCGLDGVEGSQSLPLQGKGLTITFGVLKAMVAALHGVNPRDAAAFEKFDEENDIGKKIKAMNAGNTYEGHVVHIKVRYNPNKLNPSKPFVNFTFTPVIDEKTGKVKRV